jgi:hypothetical protein
MLTAGQQNRERIRQQGGKRLFESFPTRGAPGVPPSYRGLKKFFAVDTPSDVR